MADQDRRKNDAVRNDWATKDFYQVLGVAKDASQADIKKAYRKLARDSHPDSHPDDTAKHEKFKRVAEAYDVVGQESDRRQARPVRRVPVIAGSRWIPPGHGWRRRRRLLRLRGHVRAARRRPR